MDNKFSIVQDRTVIKVSGKDSVTFLNNILTSDLNNISFNQVYLSALLSPQGKILFDLLMFKLEDNKTKDTSIYIECSLNQKLDLLKKLKLYSIRKSIFIEESDLLVMVTNKIAEYKNTKLDNRFKNKNIGRIYLTKEEQKELINENVLSDLYWYKELKALNCIPEGDLEIPTNKIYPFEIKNFYNNGISFEKGCFIGQEVVARVKYKGNFKKQYFSFEIHNNINVELKDKVIIQNELQIGKVLFSTKAKNKIIGFCILNLKSIGKEKIYIKDLKKDIIINLIQDKI